jgi:hypothetical protein
MIQDPSNAIGRITRCSTRGFVGAVRLPSPDLPTFGTFCQAEAQQGQSYVLGLIYDISIQDDEFARQMATAEDIAPEQLADAQVNRQVPVEYSAVAVGYQQGEQYFYTLPPQPPLTLAPVFAMSPTDVRRFTSRLDFLPLLLAAREIPIDDLLVAALEQAAKTRPQEEQRRFLVEAGRTCARVLSSDLVRLDNLLRGLVELG